MGIKTSFICDISGAETDKDADVVIFTITRDNITTTTVVLDDLVTEALADDDSLLASIILRDDFDTE